MKPLELAEAREIVEAEAEELVYLLSAYGMKIALAESCTSGMVAALLGRVPGVSEYFCGSTVTYRDATKQAWLGISPKLLQKNGAVSESTSLEMAIRVLDSTPEADLAASITGHLGPNAPSKLDGVIYTAVAARVRGQKNLSVFVSEHHLTAPRHLPVTSQRAWRQLAASHSLLMMVRSLLEQSSRETDQGELSNGNSKPSPRKRKRPKK